MTRIPIYQDTHLHLPVLDLRDIEEYLRDLLATAEKEALEDRRDPYASDLFKGQTLGRIKTIKQILAELLGE